MPAAGFHSCPHSHDFLCAPRSDVKNNVHYAEETQVIYPAGTNAVLWQADQKQQKIFQGPELSIRFLLPSVVPDFRLQEMRVQKV